MLKKYEYEYATLSKIKQNSFYQIINNRIQCLHIRHGLPTYINTSANNQKYHVIINEMRAKAVFLYLFECIKYNNNQYLPLVKKNSTFFFYNKLYKLTNNKKNELLAKNYDEKLDKTDTHKFNISISDIFIRKITYSTNKYNMYIARIDGYIKTESRQKYCIELKRIFESYLFNQLEYENIKISSYKRKSLKK